MLRHGYNEIGGDDQTQHVDEKKQAPAPDNGIKNKLSWFWNNKNKGNSQQPETPVTERSGLLANRKN